MTDAFKATRSAKNAEHDQNLKHRTAKRADAYGDLRKAVAFFVKPIHNGSVGISGRRL